MIEIVEAHLDGKPSSSTSTLRDRRAGEPRCRSRRRRAKPSSLTIVTAGTRSQDVIGGREAADRRSTRYQSALLHRDTCRDFRARCRGRIDRRERAILCTCSGTLASRIGSCAEFADAGPPLSGRSAISTGRCGTGRTPAPALTWQPISSWQLRPSSAAAWAGAGFCTTSTGGIFPPAAGGAVSAASAPRLASASRRNRR